MAASASLAAGATYREMHDELESLALRHLLAHFGGKPTVLARETKMNRVTLRKKVLRLSEALLELARMAASSRSLPMKTSWLWRFSSFSQSRSHRA